MKFQKKNLNRYYFGLALILLLVSCLAYGVHLPWMGFYWDDWPWVWFSHVMGPAGMLKIDIEHRPITGIVLWVGSLLAGDGPLGWQIYNLIWRFLGAVTLAWTLEQIWPRQRNQIAWVALLFLVYPGFGQQYVSVNNSRHLFPLVTLFLSFGLMVKAQRHRQCYRLFTGGGVLLSVMTMFNTEYYYGLELLRPVILVILLRVNQEPSPHNLQNANSSLAAKAFEAWLPYLIPLASLFAWRYWVSKSVNYAITIFEALGPAAPHTIWDYAGSYAQDIFDAALGSWLTIFQSPDPTLMGSRSRVYFWGLIGIGLGLTLIYTLLLRADPQNRRWGWKALPLGLAALIVGPIPFWVTGLDPRLSFPGDRLLLPSILGSCLVLVGLLDLSLPYKPAKALTVSILVGLSIGAHYQNGLDYRLDWERQKATLQQLSWRVPGLAPNTAILANQLPAQYATDNSFTAPLNWTYAPDFSGGDLPIYLYYVDLRFGQMDRVLAAGVPFKEVFRFYTFEGMPQESLVIYHKLPGCLRVLTETHDQNDPHLPPEIQSALRFSNLNRISISDEAGAALPPLLAADAQPQNWCYYFEKADLARQRGDWAQAAGLADRAFEVGFPDAAIKHVAEYVVFIEAYAHTSQWDLAREITLEAFDIDPQVAPMLCDAWQRIGTGAPASLQKSQALEELSNKLNCAQ